MTATIAKERPILFSVPMVRAVLDGRKTQTRRVVKAPKWWEGMTHYCTGNVDENSLTRTHMALCDKGASNWAFCPYGAPGDRLWVREAWRTEERASDLVDGVRFRADDAFLAIEPTEAAVDLWMEAAHFKADLSKASPVCGKVRVAVRKKRGREWRPSIHMPRWASRITLEITEVRVEQLQEISEADAIAEGLEVQLGDGTGPGPGSKWNGPAYWDSFSVDQHRGKTYHGPTPSGLRCCDAGQRERLSPARCDCRHLWDRINGKRPGCDWSTNPWVWVVSFRRLAQGESFMR
jgi:hypothetical protein